MPILPSLHGPADLRGLTEAQLEELAAEIRETIIATVSSTGGHLGSSLGVVELTIALHRLLESPRDRIVWDTGHQAYPHKLLTGRYERFGTLRQLGGVGGFPRRTESEHDVFDGGHAGTGLSIGQGLATARDLRHGMERIAVVVGDAAITSGLSLEALNDIGQRKTQLLIVLNDNEMSISPTVGALSTYLSQIKLSGTWQASKLKYDSLVGQIPIIGPSVRELGQRLRHSVVNFAQAGRLFEDLGITYIGLVPGHDIRDLLSTFAQALELPGPVIVHVRTQKGRGFKPAEADQIGFHGAALPPMSVPNEPVNGNGASRRDADQIDGRRRRAADGHRHEADGEEPQLHRGLRRRADRARPDRPPDRRDHGGHADRDRPLEVPGGVPGPVRRRRHRGAALRGARDGTRDGRDAARRRALLDVPPAGLRPDGPRRLPERPAGAARGRPGRARRRGRDEPPGDVHAAGPAPAAEPRDRLAEGRAGAAVIAPDGARPGPPVRAPLPARRRVRAPAGRAVQSCRSGAARSCARGATCCSSRSGRSWPGPSPRRTRSRARAGRSRSINARFAKPLDRELILAEARGKRLVVTFEESVVSGGFGSGVLEAIEEARLGDAALRDVPVRIIGIPGERFVDHGSVADLRQLLRIDAPGLAAQVRETLLELGATPPVRTPPAAESITA